MLTSTVEEANEKQLDSDEAVESKSFPVHLLPGFLPDYIRSVSESLACDEAMVAVPMLAGLSGIIGNSFWAAVHDSWKQPCMLWTIVIGSSGISKTPSLSAAIGPIRAISSEQIQKYKKEYKLYKEKMARWSRKSKKTDDGNTGSKVRPEKPNHERIRFDDITVEAAAQRLSKNPQGGLMISDELSKWLAGFNLYKPGGCGTDMTKWEELWNGLDIVIDRKSGDDQFIYAQRPFMAITGGIQRGAFMRIVTAEMMDSGMLARILVCVPLRPPRKSSFEAFDQKLVAKYHHLFKNLHCLRPPMTNDNSDPTLLKFTPDAKNLFIEWHHKIGKTAARTLHEGIRVALIKLQSYVPRIAGVLHVTKAVLGTNANQMTPGDPSRPTVGLEIDEDTVREAIGLAEWFGNEARRVYAIVNTKLSDEDKLIAKLLTWFPEPGTWVSQRDIKRKFRKTGATRLSVILDELVSRGILKKQQPPRKSATGRIPGLEYMKTPDPESAGGPGVKSSTGSCDD